MVVSWDELLICDSLEAEYAKLEHFLVPSKMHTEAKYSSFYATMELPLFLNIPKTVNSMRCKHVRLTKSKYPREPLRSTKFKPRLQNETILYNWFEPANVNFQVTRPCKIELPKENTTYDELLILEQQFLESHINSNGTRLKIEEPKLKLQPSYLEVFRSLTIPRIANLHFKTDSIKLPYKKTRITVEKLALKLQKIRIIVNLAFFCNTLLAKFVEEFCEVIEREDEFNFPIIQNSPTSSIAVLSPFTNIVSFPEYLNEAIILCDNGCNIPNRQLLQFLYSKGIMVYFLQSLDSLKRKILQSYEPADYLSTVETAHERLLAKGLAISSFKAQLLLSQSPLKDILEEQINIKFLH